jgi:hypothetical protein
MKHGVFLKCLACSLLVLISCSTNDSTSKSEDSAKDDPAIAKEDVTPLFSEGVAAVLKDSTILTSPGPDGGIRQVTADNLLLLLSALHTLEEEMNNALTSASQLPRGEFEKEAEWKTRTGGVEDQVMERYSKRMARISGTNIHVGPRPHPQSGPKALPYGPMFYTSVKISPDHFSYDPDLETMKVQSASSRYRNEGPINYTRIYDSMPDKVVYAYKGRRHVTNIFVTFAGNLEDGSKVFDFYFTFDGACFPPTMAPDMKELIEAGSVVANLYYILRLNLENRAVETEVCKVQFKTTEGTSLITWDSEVGFINYTTGMKFLREIRISLNEEALTQPIAEE